MGISTSPSQKRKKSHPSLAIHTPFGSHINSVTSPGKNSLHGDLIAPTRIQTLDLELHTEDIPSKIPGKNPTRMPTNIFAFMKNIKREVSQYTMLKDEKYSEGFKRNLLVTATTQGCEEILTGDYKPENNEDSMELFKQKQYFMYSVFNKVLQSDMGKTTVRKYTPSLDAQSVRSETVPKADVKLVSGNKGSKQKKLRYMNK